MSRRKPRGMYVSEWVLREQFDPYINSKKTYLLCKVQWAKSERFWIHWVRNDNDKDCHAEKYFLEEVFELRSSRICYITWYLSWSPCADCCDIIRNFLETHPNVHIDIHVARLYEIHRARTRRGLRKLDRLRGRVTIDVMKIKDYRYCWKTFIKGDDNVFLPMNFIPAINGNRCMLRSILEVEKGNNIMKEKLRVQFFSFGFQREKLIDFYLELQSHLRKPPPDSFLTWI